LLDAGWPVAGTPVRLTDLRYTDVATRYEAMRLLGEPTRHLRALLNSLLEVRSPHNPLRRLSAARIARVHAALVSALNRALRRHLIAVNPALRVELTLALLPRAVIWTDPLVEAWAKDGKRCPVAVWTPKQTGRFLDATSIDCRYPLFHHIAYRAMRRREAVGLRWQDVDLDAGVLFVRRETLRPGWQSGPTSPAATHARAASPSTVHVLRDWRRSQQSEGTQWGPAWTETGRVFTHADGTRYHPPPCPAAPHRLEAGLPPIRLHDLRHTSAASPSPPASPQGGLGAARAQLTHHHC
jgi:integrase